MLDSVLIGEYSEYCLLMYGEDIDMRITKTIVQKKIDHLNRLMGTPSCAYTWTEDGLRGNVGNYHLERLLGGYSLLQVTNEQGGCTRVFLVGAVPLKQLSMLIDAFIEGAETAKGNRSIRN